MKRVSIAACLVILSAQLVLAQAGSICLFADAEGYDCTITDIAPGLITVYVVHEHAVDVQAVQFAAPVPSCMTATFIGETSPWPHVTGISQTGILVGYPSCLSSPIHVLTMNFFGSGTTIPDCPYPVLPDPEIGYIEVTDCNDVKLPGLGGTTYVNSSLPCLCGSTGPPLLEVNPLNLDFGDIDTEKSFAIINLGGPTLTWDVTESIAWLDVSRTSGTDNSTIDVTVDRSGLPYGVHSGLINVTSNAGNETVTVTMEVPVPNPVLVVSPPALTFAALENDKILTILNGGTGDLDWNMTSDAAWLSAIPTSGGNYTEVTVHIDRTGLTDGTYYGTLTVTSNGGDGTVPVEMIVGNGPLLFVHPTSLVFTASFTSGAFSITNAGLGTLDWSLSADETWIEIVPPLSGTGDATVTVNVDPSSVPPGGTQIGHITVDSNGGTEVVDVHFAPPGPSFGGYIGVYGDAQAMNCNIVEAGGLVSVYVVHTHTTAATASQFAAPRPNCMTGATWLSDSYVQPVVIGDSQNGISVGYGACLPTPIHVLTILYFGNGATEPCCMYPVLPHPDATSGRVEVIDCEFNSLFATAGTSIVNSDDGCICGAISVKKSTWGRVKALYAPESVKAIPE
jgi:hypothetical protein